MSRYSECLVPGGCGVVDLPHRCVMCLTKCSHAFRPQMVGRHLFAIATSPLGSVPAMGTRQVCAWIQWSKNGRQPHAPPKGRSLWQRQCGSWDGGRLGGTHSLPPEEGGHQGRVARRSEHAPAGFRAVRAYWLQEWGSWSENKKACYLWVAGFLCLAA